MVIQCTVQCHEEKKVHLIYYVYELPLLTSYFFLLNGKRKIVTYIPMNILYLMYHCQCGYSGRTTADQRIFDIAITCCQNPHPLSGATDKTQILRNPHPKTYLLLQKYVKILPQNVLVRIPRVVCQPIVKIPWYVHNPHPRNSH